VLAQLSRTLVSELGGFTAGSTNFGVNYFSSLTVFEGMGFRPEALLRDQVKDREGHKHDLLILAHEVAKFLAQMEAFLCEQPTQSHTRIASDTSTRSSAT